MMRGRSASLVPRPRFGMRAVGLPGHVARSAGERRRGTHGARPYLVAGAALDVEDRASMAAAAYEPFTLARVAKAERAAAYRSGGHAATTDGAHYGLLSDKGILDLGELDWGVLGGLGHAFILRKCSGWRRPVRWEIWIRSHVTGPGADISAPYAGPPIRRVVGRRRARPPIRRVVGRRRVRPPIRRVVGRRRVRPPIRRVVGRRRVRP